MGFWAGALVGILVIAGIIYFLISDAGGGQRLVPAQPPGASDSRGGSQPGGAGGSTGGSGSGPAATSQAATAQAATSQAGTAPAGSPTVPPAGGLSDRERPEAIGPGDCRSGERCLRIRLRGPGSVQISAAGTRLQGGRGTCPPSCEVGFPGGGGATLQRRQGLPREQEISARLSGWGGDCRQLDADIEPRGGICQLSMDRDRSVEVTFEIRPRLRIVMTNSSVNAAFDIKASEQKSGGGLDFLPLPACSGSNPNCVYEYFVDLGSTVTLTAVAYAKPAPMGGACLGHQEEKVCTLTLSADSEVSVPFPGP
jgi:hypothetical protein